MRDQAAGAYLVHARQSCRVLRRRSRLVRGGAAARRRGQGGPVAARRLELPRRVLLGARPARDGAGLLRRRAGDRAQRRVPLPPLAAVAPARDLVGERRRRRGRRARRGGGRGVGGATAAAGRVDLAREGGGAPLAALRLRVEEPRQRAALHVHAHRRRRAPPPRPQGIHAGARGPRHGDDGPPSATDALRAVRRRPMRAMATWPTPTCS